MCFAKGIISSTLTFKKQIEWMIPCFVHIICFRKCQTLYPIVMENILQYYTLPAAQNHPRQICKFEIYQNTDEEKKSFTWDKSACNTLFQTCQES